MNLSQLCANYLQGDPKISTSPHKNVCSQNSQSLKLKDYLLISWRFPIRNPSLSCIGFIVILLLTDVLMNIKYEYKVQSY
jgi:hypothetical protein